MPSDRLRRITFELAEFVADSSTGAGEFSIAADVLLLLTTRLREHDAAAAEIEYFDALLERSSSGDEGMGK